jgi:hypothetical protein
MLFNGCRQPFVEWISGTLHALNLDEGCKLAPLCMVIASAMSLPKLLSEEEDLVQKRKQVSLRIEELVQKTVEERPEQILLSWGINGLYSLSHYRCVA